ncbi:MAG: peptide chain release factor 2 [Chloroflexi bacterium]|nr:peptide chain release factor 2 [Chloroflexota bacterium]
MQEKTAILPELISRIRDLMVRLDIEGKEKEIAELEAGSAAPDFWSDQAAAQAAMQRLGELREVVDRWRELEKQASDLSELSELARNEGDIDLETETQAEVDKLAARLDDLEFQLLFSGEHDRRSAILAVHAGAGGTESQDWAEILLRMYLRWAERRGFQTDVLDISPGEEAGIKSATIEVRGKYSYGYLKSERGVHRLVRLSPFDTDHARHTSFALVEVLPEPERNVDIIINPDDLRMEFFRASGAGGQNVQKNATAVRITHIPTGITASCQNERSQFQNREAAMKVLQARLMEIEMAKKAEEQAKLKGEHVAAGWGNQIRSYILHPYKLVKDHRTGYETTNPAAVLEGEIDDFLRDYLKSTVRESNP